jgi:cytochrome c
MKYFALIFSLLVLPIGQAYSYDEKAAETLARKSGCLKCHHPDRKKDGPSMKAIADKWRGKPDAENKLMTHMTSGPMVKVDGKEEQHEMLKLKSTDNEEVRNVVQFFLAH